MACLAIGAPMSFLMQEKKTKAKTTSKFEMKNWENLWKCFALNYHVILLEKVIWS